MAALSNAAKNAAIAAVGALLNGGSIQFRSGASPGPNNPASGVLLATLAFANPAFHAPVNGVVAAEPISSALTVSAGTVGYARLLTSGSVVVEDLTVTITGGGGDIEFPAIVWVINEAISLSALNLQQG